MFYPYNDYVIRDMVKQKQQAFLREAETDRLLDEMIRREAGWLSRHAKRLLQRFAPRRRPTTSALAPASRAGTATRLQASGRGG